MDSWKRIDFSNIDSPALFIDVEIVENNIQSAIQVAGGIEFLRPHVKTHKTLQVAHLQIEAGIRKFKCATIAEAEMLGLAGADDVLLAYPIQGPKIDRFQALTMKFPATKFHALVDNIHTITEIDHHWRDTSPFSAFIDINNGNNRTGIPISDVLAISQKCEILKSIELNGLHCYDGHIRNIGLAERKIAVDKAFEPVLKLKGTVEKLLRRSITLAAGGSPSFLIHAAGNYDCSPGTFVFWDSRYANDFPEMPFTKAAFLLTRVISKIDSNTYCLDLGHKSVASEFPFPRVEFISDAQIDQVGHSEEHMVIKTTQKDVFSTGDVLLAYPYHICPTVALYENIYAWNNNELNHWNVIARKRKISV